jgi:hypothetical protein
MKLKVTIIDDSLKDRREHYDCAMKDRFDIREYISTYAQFKDAFRNMEKKIEIVDVYVLDIFLDTDDWGRENVDTADLIVELINIVPFRLTPVILVSKNWKESTKVILDMLKRVRAKFASAPDHIIDYIVWDDFENKERLGALQVRLDSVISRHSSPSLFSKEPDSTIRLLMLSDTQFGDPDADPMTEVVATQIENRLRDDNRFPDLILLAGDISYSGHPDEFAHAKIWLDKLIIKLFGGVRGADKIILVPGNHDVNLRFSAANEWNYKPNKKGKGGRWKRKPQKKPVEPEKEVAKGCQDYALEAFRRFAYGIAGQKELQDTNFPTFWIDNRFIEAGLRFYVFNTVYKLDINNNKSSAFDTAALDKVSNRFI